MNKVNDDTERFSEDYSISQGGIIVGNIQEPGTNMLNLGNVTVISLH